MKEKYRLNILTVIAKEDGYTKFQDGTKERVFTKGKTYKMYGIFVRDIDYFKEPVGNGRSVSGLRYDIREDNGGRTCLSKYLINFYNLEVINQEYKPYDSMFLRREDVE